MLCLCSLWGCRVPAQTHGNLLTNPGFENGTTAPSDWIVDASTLSKGRITFEAKLIHGGKRALRLEPTSLNSDPSKPFGAGQVISVAPYRGKKLWISAWLGAGEGARATFIVLALKGDGTVAGMQSLDRSDAQGGLTQFEDLFAVPNDGSVDKLIVGCVVSGTSGWAVFDDLAISPDIPSSMNRNWVDPGPPIQASVSVDASHVIRRIPRTLYGVNTEWIWEGKGLWDPKQSRLSPEVIQLTRDLGTTLVRYPGGTFSDFYHWKLAVGPQSERPSTKPVPTDGPSRHSLGTNEILDFAKQTNTQLIFTANAGSGTPEEAAEWVRYTGKAVKYWEVGNELYLDDHNLGSQAVTKTPAQYASLCARFCDAMRTADPNIKLGAILDESFYPMKAYQGWTETVLPAVAPKIDFVAVHNAYAPAMPTEGGKSLRSVYAATLAAPVLVKGTLDSLVAKIHKLNPVDAKRIKIAVTEWGTLYQILPSGSYVDHCKTLGSALYTASTMKAFLDTPEVEVANYFSLIDPLFIGLLGERSGNQTPTASYLALQMYTKHFGDMVVASKTTSPTYSSERIGWVSPVANVPYVECVSSTGDDGHSLHVLLINKHFDRDAKVDLTLAGFPAVASADCWTLGGTGIDANTGTHPMTVPGFTWAKQAEDEVNPRFEKGGPDEVWLRHSVVNGMGSRSSVTVPAHSVICLILHRK